MQKALTLLGVVLLIALRTLGTGIQPLSLGLLSFSGFNKGAVVTLDWEAMSWSTSRVFTIERSVDGVNWTRIKEVDAQTTGANSVHYTADDEKPVIGNAFYRIGLSNDLGERAVSSPVRVFTASAQANSISLYPNPCKDLLQLGGFGAGSTVVVRNAAGMEMFHGTSNERLSISTGAWQSGVYFVTIASADGRLYQGSILHN